MIFRTWWITFFLSGFGELSGIHVATGRAAAIRLIHGLRTMDTSFALVTNATFDKAILPVGAPPEIENTIMEREVKER